MRIACISDTHCQLKAVTVPKCDVLVHAGDLTYRGTVGEVQAELDVLRAKSRAVIVLVAGNHDWLAQRQHALFKQMCEDRNIVYLEDSGVELFGLKFWGSPWQPEFNDWAFNLSRDDGSLAERWSHIPDDTDVLITHSPPMKTGDLTAGYDGEPPRHAGCYEMRQRIGKLEKLKLHVFGHIHHAYGRYEPDPPDFVPSNNQPVRRNIAVNASVCNEHYDPVNAPIVVEV